MDYIRCECGGRLFALGGVSLGGQIVMELLARNRDVAEKAIIDGACVFPSRLWHGSASPPFTCLGRFCSAKGPAAASWP